MTTNITSALLSVSALACAGSQAAAPAQSKTGYVDVNGIHLYYEEHGTGSPVVLLHGGLASMDIFGKELIGLTAEHRVIAVDLQGHGKTALGERPITYQAMADDVAALLGALAIDKADVVGFSLGGGVALQTAVRHPDRVNKLVLISTPFTNTGWHPEIQAGLSQISSAAAEAMKNTPMFTGYAARAPRVEDFPKLLDALAVMFRQDYDWSESVKGLKLPVLVVAGDSDGLPPTHAVALYNLLGGGLKDAGWTGEHKATAKLAILPNASHYDILYSPILPPVLSAFLR